MSQDQKARPTRAAEAKSAAAAAARALDTGTPLLTNARRDGTALLMGLHGEIDLHNSPEVRQALLDLLRREQPKQLVLDVSDVPYMDSSAIAVLVEALKLIRRFGGLVALTHLQPRVRGLLEIARLDSIFTIAESDEQVPRG
jgi:anti-sigma B factor antagonist